MIHFKIVFVPFNLYWRNDNWNFEMAKMAKYEQAV